MSINQNRTLIYMGGLNGSGKTTISDEVAKALPEVTVFHASALLRGYLGLSYAELDRLTPSEQIAIRQRFYSSKVFDCNTPCAIIDAHYIIPRGNQEFEVCVEEGWAGRVGWFVHVVSEPRTIVERLSRDRTETERRRAKFFADGAALERQIAHYQEVSLKTATQIARKLFRPFRTINNNTTIEDSLSRAKEIVAQVIANGND